MDPEQWKVLLSNSPTAGSLVFCVVYFLRHISVMNASRDKREEAVLEALTENTQALTRLENTLSRK